MKKKPWALMKDKKHQHEVQMICTMGINLFRVLMIYLKPVLPKTAEQVEKFLNIAPLQWSDKDHALLDHSISEFQPLIKRIEAKQIEEMKMDVEIKNSNQMTTPDTQETQAKDKPTISIDDFSKIDLRVAKIVAAEFVEGADKLLSIKVDLGGETKQIFAGIKLAYKPEELIGRHVVVVANLAPRQMRFGLSEGMLLVAGPGGSEIWLLSPDPGAEAGMKVK